MTCDCPTCTHPSHRLLLALPQTIFYAPSQTDCSSCPTLLHKLIPMPLSFTDCSSLSPLTMTALHVPMFNTDCFLCPPLLHWLLSMPPCLSQTAPMALSAFLQTSSMVPNLSLTAYTVPYAPSNRLLPFPHMVWWSPIHKLLHIAPPSYTDLPWYPHGTFF